jgi:hypothetical protein
MNGLSAWILVVYGVLYGPVPHNAADPANLLALVSGPKVFEVSDTREDCEEVGRNVTMYPNEYRDNEDGPHDYMPVIVRYRCIRGTGNPFGPLPYPEWDSPYWDDTGPYAY